MTNKEDIWYYGYLIKYWDEIDKTEGVNSGIVPASSLSKAMEMLEEYYGGIEEVQMLKPISEGLVFDFQSLLND